MPSWGESTPIGNACPRRPGTLRCGGWPAGNFRVVGRWPWKAAWAGRWAGPRAPAVAAPSCQPYCLLTTRGQPPGHQPRVAVGTVPGETRSKLVPKQNSPAGPSVPGAPAALRVHRRPGTERVVIRVAARRRCRHKSDVDQSSPSHPRHQRTRARSASSPTASHSTTRTPGATAHGRTPSPKPPPPGPRGVPAASRRRGRKRRGNSSWRTLGEQPAPAPAVVRTVSPVCQGQRSGHAPPPRMRSPSAA